MDVMFAQLVALTANLNRDVKKVPKPFSLQDFCLFHRKEEDNSGISAVSAAIALQLRAEDRCPPLLVANWPHVLAALKDDTAIPTIRALHSDDDTVWIIAPVWEGWNVRGGLVAVRGRISGRVRVRDLDRPLNTYDLQLPEREGFGWVEGDCLLLSAES